VTTWVQFTKRTEDPKLCWIEARLTDLGIAHRRNGRSFHAPILEVDETRISDAWKLMDQPGVNFLSIDSMPDDHWMFGGTGGAADEDDEKGKRWVWLMPTWCPNCQADLTRPEALDCSYSYGRSGPPSTFERVLSTGQMTDSQGSVGEGICCGAFCTECNAEVERIETGGPEIF
jgi:hypothetical protein